MLQDYGLKQLFPDNVDDSSTSQQNGLGIIRFEGNKEYRYVQVVDKALAAGDVACIASTADGIVTADVSGGSQVAAMARGVAVAAIASGSYGWIQTKGVCTINCDGTVVTGSGLVPSASTDGVADVVDATSNVTNTEYKVFGFALTQDSGTTNGTATAYINCP